MDYNEITTLWADAHRYSPAPRHRRRLILNIINKLEFSSCLDVGCSQPYLLEYLAGKDKKLFGCDISEDVITKNSSCFTNASFKVIDITKNVYPNQQKFDLVVCSEVIEHVEDWVSAIINLTSMSTRHLVITVPVGKIRAIDKMVGHIRHFAAKDLANEITKQGFRVILVRRWGFPFHSLYKFVINAIVPHTVYKNFAIREYKPSQVVIANILYYMFFVNDLFNFGEQLIITAEKQ